jgi:hypothetical protein
MPFSSGPLTRTRKKTSLAGSGVQPVTSTPALWKPALVVAVVAIAASVTGLFNGFALDDLHLIVEDPRAHSFGDLSSIFASPYWPPPISPDLYRPLATLSFAIQWMLGGGSALTFRVISYLLYVAMSLGVLALARRLLPETVALGVALLFAAHPVHVEAVALGVNQGEQIVGLISVIAAIRYLDLRRCGWPSPLDWLVLSVAYAVAFLFKENALVLPGLFLAIELTLLERAPLRERVLRLGPAFLAMAALGGAFLAVRAAILGSLAGSFTADAMI